MRATTAQQPKLLFELFEYHNPAQNDFAPLKQAGYKLSANPIHKVIQAALQSGAVALIAHPRRTDSFTTFDADLLDQFHAEIQLMAFYYPRHTAKQTIAYESYANQHNLLISAASDSHTPDQCAALLARLDIEVKY